MKENNMKMYFGILKSTPNDPFDLNETGVSGGILFTRENLEDSLSYFIHNPLYGYSVNEYYTNGYELWLWLGHEGYIYQGSAIKVAFADLNFFTHLFEEPIKAKVKIYPRGKSGSHGHRACYRKSSKVKNLGKNVHLVDDWAKIFPQLNGKNRREKVFLQRVATDWDSQVTVRGNGWKDNSKLRHQWERGL